jgi:2-oxoisovalerate dehydrogenase E1 component
MSPLMDRPQLLALYRAALTARQIDLAEQELTSRGEAFFHVEAAGHEGSASLAFHLTENDWLHCHYRDRALLLARGIPIREFFDVFFCKDGSSSRGRRMSPFVSDRRLKILSMVTPTGNNALQSVGVAAAVKNEPQRPLVYCGVGDGTTQQGEYLEACGEAVRDSLPVLFVVQDNGWAISTRTKGRTFYSLPNGPAAEFMGMKIRYVDGSDPVVAFREFETVVGEIRRTRGPQLVVLHVERLANHSNADDQTLYRDSTDIARAHQSGDPLLSLERSLRESGVDDDELQLLRKHIVDQVAAAAAEAVTGRDPIPESAAKQTLPVELTHVSSERRGAENGVQLTMRDAMREVLRTQLRDKPSVCLVGEDIEDPKGDVFGVTRGLSTEFPQRVCNSPLSESTIVGTAIGRALAGQHPVAFLQFADFMPQAYNQLTSELGSLHWRTDGQWTAPVIVMMACGGYRPGLGPFHAQTFESVLAHAPGLDVCMPSNAADAAGMLNAAFRSRRPTLFLYPKSCLNDGQRATTGAVEEHFVPIGTACKVRSGRDITFVGWGNTVRLCEQAADALESVGCEAEVIDLRSISPWDEHMVVRSAEKTARLVVVHEDNQTCGFAAEILATVAAAARMPVSMRRVTRADTLVPCNIVNQLDILPSFKRTLATACELLDFKLTWAPPEEDKEGVFSVNAIGSGPADETVEVVELHVQPEQSVKQGDPLVTVEATKSVVDIASPVAGTVLEVFAVEGEDLLVGAPVVKIQLPEGESRKKPVTQERSGTPILKRRKSRTSLPIPVREVEHRAFDVGISSVTSLCGSRHVSNADLMPFSDGLTPHDILRRTGIESRRWIGDNEDAVGLAIQACQQLLDREKLTLDDLDLAICSTTSPTSVTPSMACRVINGLTTGKSEAMLQAYDINAACSGYLYALQSGYDYLQSAPHGRVLIVTAEVLSPLLNPADFDTAILFGDATSATILYGEAHLDKTLARLHRPEVSAKAEDGSTLSVPLLHDGFIQMKGRKVFSEAVRMMVTSLNRTCDRAGIGMDDLKLVIPHQANQRILDAIHSRIHLPVYSNIRTYGNTSSSSIPLCLTEVLPQAGKGDRLGLCAFGGGFTFGAGILQVN